MKKRRVLFLLICLLITLVSGCSVKYEKSDIEDYLSEQCGLSGFEVSRKYQEIEGEDGYTDKLWTIKDKKNGFEYHVLDDFAYRGEAVSNVLTNDYFAALLKSIYSKLPSYPHVRITIEQDEEEMYSSGIEGTYKNLEELKTCLKEIETLQSEFDKLGFYNLSVYFLLKYDHPYRTIGNYEDTVGDVSGYTDETRSKRDYYRYVYCVLDYRYDEMNRLDTGLIQDAVSDKYYYCVGIYTGEKEKTSEYEKDKVEFYDDIFANRFSYGISFSSFYEILRREGFNPRGDKNHFCFIGNDGSVYEFSYEFNDMVFDNSLCGYYYKKDGASVSMDAYFYNHLSSSQIYKMTGLKIYIGSRN